MRAMVSLMGWPEDRSMVVTMTIATPTIKGTVLCSEMDVELAVLEAGVIFMVFTALTTYWRDQQIQ